MEHPEEQAPVSRKEFVQILQGIRFAVAAVLLVLAYMNLRAALSIGSFQQIFNDMLNGKPLPAITLVVLEHRNTLTLLALLIPAAALVCLVIKRGFALSFYALGILTLLALVQLVIVTGSLTAPLFTVIKEMQNGPAPADPR